MAQSTDYNISANPSGFDMRTEINGILSAIVSDNSGTSEPLNPTAFMKWWDTSNATYYYLKERNHTNDGWISVLRYTVATKVIDALSNGLTVVKSSGDETLAGVKTFSSSPIVPNATTATQAIAFGQAVNLTAAQTIAGVKTFTSPPLNASSLPLTPNYGYKNYIINGNFNIWQRGTSQTTSSYGSADRWSILIGGGGSAAKHGTYPNTILLTTTAASSIVNISQAIESATVLGLRGKTVTLSLNIAIGGTHTGAMAISARYSTSSDILANQTTTIQSLPISASSANTRYSLTFTVPTDAVGLRIDIENSVAQPSGALYHVQEVQLEEGSVATPFEQRPYGLELKMCQDYYEAGTSELYIGTVGSWKYSVPCFFKTRKRVIPTMTAVNVTNFGFPVAYGISDVSVNGFVQYRIATEGKADSGFAITWTASAEL